MEQVYPLVGLGMQTTPFKQTLLANAFAGRVGALCSAVTKSILTRECVKKKKGNARMSGLGRS
jgi:hypothetical protein